MFDGLPRRFARLSRRLLHPPEAMQKALREAAELLTPLIPAAPLRAPTGFAAGAAGRVVAVESFGANPGRLRMLVHVPPQPPRPGAPLLVLLHGCGQDAAGFAAAAGFVALANRLGAALLLPEQQSANNQGRCFNWFLPADTTPGAGEAESVHQMVADALQRFAADPARVFVAGLSAGAAMAAALLAAYPRSFAAGGAVAGLPVGAAHDLGSALNRMSRAASESRASLIARVGEPGAGRWPRLSVWAGAADHTVDPANSEALALQWSGLHGLPELPDQDSAPLPGLRRRAWGTAVEHWSLAGFGHAFPVAVIAGADPFVQPAPIQAADAMARFWGLDPG